MDWPYELQIGWRYTRAGRSGRRNRFISFISAASMAGIALGVAALIIVLSVMNGFRKEVRDRMLSVVSHVEVGAAGGEALADWRATAERVRRHPQVAALAPFVAAEALVARGDEMRGIVVRGILPAEEAGVTELAAGAKDVLARLGPESGNVVLGVELAKALRVKEGDKVSLILPGRRTAAPPAWCRAWARSPSPAPSTPATSSTTTAWRWCISTTRSGCSSSPARTACACA